MPLLRFLGLLRRRRYIGTIQILHGSTASPAVIENKIIGEPEVKCGLNGIEVYFATMHSFFGRMYVQVPQPGIQICRTSSSCWKLQ